TGLEKSGFSVFDWMYLDIDVRALGLKDAEHDVQSSPALNYRVLQHLSVGQEGMWHALVMMLALISTLLEYKPEGMKIILSLFCDE
ncbi:unnamed protein product, partial [Symbiodinium sp. CCMP2592]